jgi:N-glycosylase/DNA lyase
LQRSVRVCEPTDVVARLSAKLREEAADQNLPSAWIAVANDTAVPKLKLGSIRRVLWVESSEADATQPAKLTRRSRRPKSSRRLHREGKDRCCLHPDGRRHQPSRLS